MSSSPNASRLHSLDGLRAVAVTLVVLHHLGVAGLAQGLAKSGHSIIGRLLSSMTASGVELFFVLSGVVLLRPYLRDRRPMDLAVYCRRRFLRLYPPFLPAWLLSGLSVWLVWTFPTWWSSVSALPAFDTTDWLAQLGILYFGSNAYNFAWWSLTIELIFYLCAPVVVLLLAAAKDVDRAVSWLLLLCLLVALAAHADTSDRGWLSARDVKLFGTYLSCFAAGVFLARQDLPRPWRLLSMAAGLILVLAAAAVDVLNIHVGWGLFYFGIVAEAMDGSSLLARFLSRDALVWLGERSYSIFLTHYAVIVIVCLTVSAFVPGKGLAYFVVSRLVAVVGLLVVAVAVFHFIERRFARSLVTADRLLPWSRAK